MIYYIYWDLLKNYTLINICVHKQSYVIIMHQSFGSTPPRIFVGNLHFGFWNIEGNAPPTVYNIHGNSPTPWSSLLQIGLKIEYKSVFQVIKLLLTMSMLNTMEA